MRTPSVLHGRHGGPGVTLHSPRLYDWVASAFTLGRERRLRERMLDVAGVVAGDHVIDVACGTGTLALAAERRVGANGSVQGVDASKEMLERAREKAARVGAPVTFAVAPAQALPFSDERFDVALCTLAMHHVPEADRGAALAEMFRVVKLGGRVLVVDFAARRGLWAFLHPVTLLHSAMRREVLEEIVEGMKRTGLGDVKTDALGFGLGYALARRT